MSVRVSSWVWHECPTLVNGVAIAGRELVVLLALADISDDEGVCTYGAPSERKQGALAAKTRLSESTFRRTIRRLEEAKVVKVEKDGLMNEYRIQMDVVQDATGQSDLLVTPEIEPVDNSEMGNSDRYYRSAVTGHKDVIRKDLTTSSSSTHVKAREAKSDDDQNSSRPTPMAIRHHKAGIDWSTVLVKVPAFKYFAPDDLHTIGAEILERARRAGTNVVDETSYVAQALFNDPFEWEKRARDADAARPSRGGNPF